MFFSLSFCPIFLAYILYPNKTCRQRLSTDSILIKIKQKNYKKKKRNKKNFFFSYRQNNKFHCELRNPFSRYNAPKPL